MVLDEYSGGNSNSCLKLNRINEEFEKPCDHVWFSDAIEDSTPNKIMWNFFKGNCALTSSTNESTEQLFELYPNLVKQKLKINNAIKQEYIVSEINGELVLKGRIESNKAPISIPNLQNGIYIIKIGTQSLKLIKVYNMS